MKIITLQYILVFPLSHFILFPKDMEHSSSINYYVKQSYNGEIQMLTPLDILTFYIWDLLLRRILMILQFLFNLITCIRTISQSTDVHHITNLHQIAYVQRIRCIKNSP
jgi:hypothetical protein